MTDYDEPMPASDDILESSTRAGILGGQLQEQSQDELQEQEELDRYGDNDSAIELSSTSSSTSSVSSSILNYRTINGRAYHSDRWDLEYWGPVDEPQIEALEYYDLAFFALLGRKLHRAPLEENIERALDIGTGTGRWAIDFANEYPDADVVGTDISPIQKRLVPENLWFELDDCTQDWTWDDDYFDFVHIRWLAGSVKDWGCLFAEAYRYLKPGGFLESHEPSFQFRSDHESIKPGSALAELGEVFVKAGQKTGCSFTIADDGTQKKSMQDAGFIIVREERFKMPIGGWCKDPKLKELGKIALEAFRWDLDGYLLYVTTQVLSWSEDNARNLAMRVRRQLREEKMYVYVKHNVVVGQKPQSPYDSHV
ncbi:S-adenosyl-L-methionine-dependent methyltransferase [Ilyonectria sp. MPI-CAGE-AT-0026]|nr:S-adenosyl-L-methionine-dependent methyltransferase [Ilyonectria sp. MPI-CAGE-AT-0026]